MPCCGSARRSGAEDPPAPAGTIRVGRHIYKTAVFQYTGRTRLTAEGAMTRKIYRFDRPGARLIVDGRDVASLSGIPNLIRI